MYTNTCKLCFDREKTGLKPGSKKKKNYRKLPGITGKLPGNYRGIPRDITGKLPGNYRERP